MSQWENITLELSTSHFSITIFPQWWTLTNKAIPLISGTDNAWIPISRIRWDNVFAKIYPNCKLYDYSPLLLGNFFSGQSATSQNATPLSCYTFQFPRIFIITDRQLLWLPLTDCSTHKTYNECIRAHDPHCGWSWPESRCADGYDLPGTDSTSWFTAFSPSVDRRSPTHAQCPTDSDGMDDSSRRSAAWSTWYPCRLLNPDESRYGMMDGVKTYGRSQGICRCRVCLSQTDCVLGTQEVINCTRKFVLQLPT